MPKETFNNLPDEKRDQIIQVAMIEFSDNPYHVASISNIVRKSGIAKGSFYQYFEDKQDLYRTLLELSMQKKQQLMKQLPTPDPSADLFAYFRWQFLSTVIFEIRYPLLSLISFRAFIEEVPFQEMTEELRRRGTTQFFKQLISQGALHGDVAVWVDPDVAAFLLETVFYQFGKYFINRLGLSEDDDLDMRIFQNEEAQYLLNNLMDILEAGLKREASQRRTYFNKE